MKAVPYSMQRGWGDASSSDASEKRLWLTDPLAPDCNLHPRAVAPRLPREQGERPPDLIGAIGRLPPKFPGDLLHRDQVFQGNVTSILHLLDPPYVSPKVSPAAETITLLNRLFDGLHARFSACLGILRRR
jgi:hypothetical protein